MSLSRDEFTYILFSYIRNVNFDDKNSKFELLMSGNEIKRVKKLNKEKGFKAELSVFSLQHGAPCRPRCQQTRLYENKND